MGIKWRILARADSLFLFHPAAAKAQDDGA